MATAEDVRVLYLMRDPVARLWSHVRMIAQRTAPDDFTAEARRLLQHIAEGRLEGEAKGIVRRGDYAAILPRLSRNIAPDRLKVMFTEDLLTEGGMDELSRFLGIRPVAADLARRVHEGQPLDMTSDDLRAARRCLRSQYEYVSRQFPALPAAWRANMEGEIA